MKQAKYTQQQLDSFENIVINFKKKNYSELKQLADSKFSDTFHPREDVQISVNVIYDNKDLGSVRCTIALYTVDNKPWWHFWDSAVVVKDFVITPEGKITES